MTLSKLSIFFLQNLLLADKPEKMSVKIYHFGLWLRNCSLALQLKLNNL
jgi:hypothetical protein